MMLLTQIFCAQSGMDIINTNHKERNGYFNITPSDEKIPGCTNTINDVLSKQPNKRVADDQEKEQLLKTEMARAIIHGGQLTNDYHALQRQYATNAKHFECLEIIQKLSNWFVEKITDPCFTSSVIGDDVLLQNSLSQLIQGNEEKSRALTKLCTYCKLQENKITQWFVETLSEHMDGFKVLFKKNLSQQKFIQDIKNGTEIDEDDFPYKDAKFALPTFREVIDNPEHPNMGQILYQLLEHGTSEDKEKVRSLSLSKSPRQALAASVVWWHRSANNDRDTVRPILRAITQNPHHPDAFEAAQCLRCGNKEDKAIAVPILRAIAQDPRHKKAFYAAQNLFYEDAEGKAIARPILRAIVQDPRHKKSFYAAQALFYGNIEDKAIARPILRKIVQNKNDPNACSAAQCLFHGNNEEDKAIARPILRAAAQNQNDENACHAAQALFNHGNDEDKEIARTTLRIAVKNQGDENATYAAQTLFYGDDEDKEIVRPILRAKAQDADDPNAYYIAQTLFCRAPCYMNHISATCPI